MAGIVKLIVCGIAIAIFAILVLSQYVLPKDQEGRK